MVGWKSLISLTVHPWTIEVPPFALEEAGVFLQTNWSNRHGVKSKGNCEDGVILLINFLETRLYQS